MPRAALAGTLPDNVSSEAGALLLKRLAKRKDIAIHGEIVARAGFESSLDDAQSELAERLRERFSQTGLDPPALRTIAEDSGEDERRLRAIAHYLEREKVLIAAPDDLFFDRTKVLELIDRVVAHFESNDELDTQTLKALIGTSRRTAMPLMALLDDLQITRRDGSIRRLIGAAPHD
jgi:selenocysteine-specific elongation factor